MEQGRLVERGRDDGTLTIAYIDGRGGLDRRYVTSVNLPALGDVHLAKLVLCGVLRIPGLAKDKTQVPVVVVGLDGVVPTQRRHLRADVRVGLVHVVVRHVGHGAAIQGVVGTVGIGEDDLDIALVGPRIRQVLDQLHGHELEVQRRVVRAGTQHVGVVGAEQPELDSRILLGIGRRDDVGGGKAYHDDDADKQTREGQESEPATVLDWARQATFSRMDQPFERPLFGAHASCRTIVRRHFFLVCVHMLFRIDAKCT